METTRRDEVRAYERGIETAFSGMLDLIDDCSRALDSLAQDADPSMRAGLEGMIQHMVNHFEKLGFESVYPLGERFDPNLHQAVTVENSSAAEGVILRVHQMGWRHGGELVRAAQVTISRHEDEPLMRRRRRRRQR